jgi:two-component system OmpR family sensor kinase
VDGSALLVVADDGPGLAPEHAERVFERFYRVDTARTRAQGGSGLGLSIVASLTAAHGGVVDVVSAPGAGTRFTVRLPLHQGAPSQSIATHTVADLH